MQQIAAVSSFPRFSLPAPVLSNRREREAKLNPLNRARRPRTAVPSSCRFGNRCTARTIAIRPSNRATAIPAHACAPAANARWRFGCRAMSKRSGSANSSGSRFAAPMQSVRYVPGSSTRRRRSRCARRRGGCRADSGSRSAGIPRPPSDQLRRRRAARCALVRIVEQQLQPVADEIRRRLVSGVQQEDAVVQQLRLASSRSPPSCSRISRLSRSSSPRRCCAPLARPARADSRRNSRHRCARRARSCSASATGSSAPRIASDQPRSGPRSSCGTRSRLPITSTGIAAAKSLDQIDLAARLHRSSRRSTSAARPGSMPRCTRGVSAPTICRRTRV